MAVNCRVCPTATLWGDTVIVIEVITAGTTVSIKELQGALLRVAVMVAEPTPMPFASPGFGVLNAAKLGLDEVHVTWDVMSAVEPSEYFPWAAKDWVSPAAMDRFAGGFAGAMVIDASTAGVTFNTTLPTARSVVAVIATQPVW
jgi:hypothetical protein